MLGAAGKAWVASRGISIDCDRASLSRVRARGHVVADAVNDCLKDTAQSVTVSSRLSFPSYPADSGFTCSRVMLCLPVFSCIRRRVSSLTVHNAPLPRVSLKASAVSALSFLHKLLDPRVPPNFSTNQRWRRFFAHVLRFITLIAQRILINIRSGMHALHFKRSSNLLWLLVILSIKFCLQTNVDQMPWVWRFGRHGLDPYSVSMFQNISSIRPITTTFRSSRRKSL